MEQGHLFQHTVGLKANARRTDPKTSKLAAQSISSDRIRESQMEILGILKSYGPLSDNKIFEYVERQSVSGARTRRCELVRRGLVGDSLDMEVTVSGRMSIVWKLEDGKEKRIHEPREVRS